MLNLISIRRTGLLILFILVAFSTSVTPVMAGDWPMFRHNPSHTGDSPSAAPHDLYPLWNRTFIYGFGMVWSSPAVANGMVIVGSLDDHVYALNQYTGTDIWNFTTGSQVFSSPAVVNGMVFVGSNDFNVYALDQFTGALVWNYTTGGEVRSSPVVVDGLVFIGSYDGKLYALNQYTGAEIWNYTITWGGVSSSPAVSNNMVLFGGSDNKVYALNQFTGIEIWNYTTGESVGSSPAAVDGMVFIGSNDNKVYALNQSTGIEIWNYTTGDDVRSSPAVADNIVFVGSNDGYLYALDQFTGEQIWNFTGPYGVVDNSPAVADGIVFTGTAARLYALNQFTGIEIWNYYIGDVSSSPAVADGMVFVGVMNPPVHLFAFGIYSSTAIRPLDVQVGVGSLHFGGEIAEFYVLTSLDGTLINGSITRAMLYHSNGTTAVDLTAQSIQISTGLCRIPYTIPPDTPNGTYTLTVEVEYFTLDIFAKGVSFGTFQVSSALNSWNAWLTEIHGGVATIQTDMQVLKVNLTDINAEIINIQSGLAIIETDLGTVLSDLIVINASLVSIEGRVAVIQTDLGVIHADISDIGDELAGWHVTSLDLVSGAITYELFVLTTSCLDEVTISDSVLTLIVSEVDGSSGVTHVVVSKALVSSLGSSLDRIVMTLDGEEVEFLTGEDGEAYTLTISYTHNIREIKVYLVGLAGVDLTFVFIFGAAVAIVAALAVAFYVFKIRGRL